MIGVEDLMTVVEKGRNPYFYDHISGFEVKFGPESDHWKLRKIPESGTYGGIWIDFNKDSCISKFNRFMINIGDFQNSLHSSCLTEAIYHKMVYDNLRELLGYEVVDIAEKDYKVFGENLVGAIKKALKRSVIKLVY